MNENQAVLAHLLKIGVNGFDSFWSIVDNSDEEAHFLHLLAYRVTTAFDLLNQLGGLGVVFDVSYVSTSKSDAASLLISKDEPIEIEIRAIPDSVIQFNRLGL
jgi:hypothetical protein